MAKKKVEITYHCTRPAKAGHPQPVTVRAERSEGSAELCWLTIAGPDEKGVAFRTDIFLDHAAALALWTQLGPIVRDQRTAQAIRAAFAESDRRRGIGVEATP